MVRLEEGEKGGKGEKGEKEEETGGKLRVILICPNI